jgi:hypothetical protein
MYIEGVNTDKSWSTVVGGFCGRWIVARTCLCDMSGSCYHNVSIL